MATLEFRDPTSGGFVAIEFGSTPVGAIASWMGTTAPEGWAICDGNAHGSAKLQAVTGSATTPDLRDRFIVSTGSSYAAGAVGGAAAEVLNSAQSGLVNHTHSGSTGGETANHAHSFPFSTAASHRHGAHYRTDKRTNTDWSETAGGDVILITNGSTTINALYGAHNHSFSSSGISNLHGHGITVDANGAANASAPHENMPPYYALAFIICTG